jgi:hypothetical protein
MPVEYEHQRVHALIQGHLAHDMHAGVHEPDKNDGGVSLCAATHLGSNQELLRCRLLSLTENSKQLRSETPLCPVQPIYTLRKA